MTGLYHHASGNFKSILIGPAKLMNEFTSSTGTEHQCAGTTKLTQDSHFSHWHLRTGGLNYTIKNCRLLYCTSEICRIWGPSLSPWTEPANFSTGLFHWEHMLLFSPIKLILLSQTRSWFTPDFLRVFLVAYSGSKSESNSDKAALSLITFWYTRFIIFIYFPGRLLKLKPKEKWK